MFGIGPMELVLILVVALLVFGPKRMPELARTLGRGMGEFRRASAELRQSLALDDLQKDLRDGLTGENSIQRPAQAGDSLPSPKKPDEAAAPDEAEEGTPSTSPSTETAPQTGGVETEAAHAPHPGELPLDNDYEHNEVSTESESADTANAAVSTAGPEATLGDSELGNIPVSRPKVGARKTDPERG